MGADNWTTCPKCLAEANKAKDKIETALGRRLKAAYGKVSAEEYKKLLTEVPTPPTVLVAETFAEYVEFDMSKTGKFSVHYSAGCRTCGFNFEFKHEVQALK